MARASIGNGIQSKNVNPACPNFGKTGHTKRTSSSGRRTSAQVRSALATINFKPGSRLARCAAYRAFTASLDADDLVQEALLRAITTRSCPAHIAIEHFLMGIMRSIASKAIEKRERADEAMIEYGRAYSNAPLSPEESFARDESADMCRRSIERVVAGSLITERVLDGIERGLCGKALADFAGVDQVKLATVRRKIKRRVAGVWTASAADLDEPVWNEF